VADTWRRLTAITLERIGRNDLNKGKVGSGIEFREESGRAVQGAEEKPCALRLGRRLHKFPLQKVVNL